MFIVRKNKMHERVTNLLYCGDQINIRQFMTTFLSSSLVNGENVS